MKKIRFIDLSTQDLNFRCTIGDLKQMIFVSEVIEFKKWLEEKRCYDKIDDVTEFSIKDFVTYKRTVKIKIAKENPRENNDENMANEINKICEMHIPRDVKIKKIAEVQEKYNNK